MEVEEAEDSVEVEVGEVTVKLRSLLWIRYPDEYFGSKDVIRSSKEGEQ